MKQKKSRRRTRRRTASGTRRSSSSCSSGSSNCNICTRNLLIICLEIALQPRCLAASLPPNGLTGFFCHFCFKVKLFRIILQCSQVANSVKRQLHKLPTNSRPPPPLTSLSLCCINNFRTLLSTLCAVSSALDKFAQFFGQKNAFRCEGLRRPQSVDLPACWPGREKSGALCEGNNKVSSVAAQRGRLKEPQGTTSNKDNDNEFIRRVFACFQYLLSF